MKKGILSLLALGALASANAADMWVWFNGEYQHMQADSVTFVDPFLQSVDTTNTNADEYFTVYGDYSGSMAISLMGMSAGNGNPNVTVAEKDGKTTLSIGEFSASGVVIAGLAADDVAVEVDDLGIYHLDQSSFSSQVLLNGEKSELTGCSLTAQVSNTGAISLTLNLQVSGLPIQGKYTGQKQ